MLWQHMFQMIHEWLDIIEHLQLYTTLCTSWHAVLVEENVMQQRETQCFISCCRKDAAWQSNWGRGRLRRRWSGPVTRWITSTLGGGLQNVSRCVSRQYETADAHLIIKSHQISPEGLYTVFTRNTTVLKETWHFQSSVHHSCLRSHCETRTTITCFKLWGQN